MNYKDEDKELIESANCRYYEFTNEIIEKIVNKDIKDVTNEEWRTLIQMLYPKNMIGSGLFQPILIFKISKNGKRIDPPIEVYNSLDDIQNSTCLFYRIIDYIEKNSNIKIDESFYKFKERISETDTNQQT